MFSSEFLKRDSGGGGGGGGGGGETRRTARSGREVGEIMFIVASGTDRQLDITFGLQVVESSSLVSVLFREALSHPYISFFHLLLNGF